MRHFVFLLGVVAALMLPTYIFSQDSVRVLQEEQRYHARAPFKGAPYLSANDDMLGKKPVLWQCMDENNHEIEDIKSIMVVMAHQPDLPLRPTTFRNINKIYDDYIEDYIENGGTRHVEEMQIVMGLYNNEEPQYNYMHKTVPIENSAMDASLLVYVYLKLNGGRKNYSLAPLTAYYDSSSELKEKKLQDLRYYAPDCAAANKNGSKDYSSRGIVVPPFGRADDHPAFRITVLGNNGEHYITTWRHIVNFLEPWREAADKSIIRIKENQKIKNLLLHTPPKVSNASGISYLPLVPLEVSVTDKNWTNGDLLRHYFDYHDGKGNPINPVFLADLNYSFDVRALKGSASTAPWFKSTTIHPRSNKTRFPGIPAGSSRVGSTTTHKAPDAGFNSCRLPDDYERLYQRIEAYSRTTRT